MILLHLYYCRIWEERILLYSWIILNLCFGVEFLTIAYTVLSFPRVLPLNIARAWLNLIEVIFPLSFLALLDIV